MLLTKRAAVSACSSAPFPTKTITTASTAATATPAATTAATAVAALSLQLLQRYLHTQQQQVNVLTLL
jgi:hypothetical protein